MKPIHEYKLKHGQAMVITGPQGWGKTTLARKIAAQHGTFAEIGVHELETYFGLGNALASEPDTLVVEGFPTNAETIAKIKSALACSTVICHWKHQEPKAMKTPNFIFCSIDENPLHLDAQDRRFVIIKLNGLPELIDRAEDIAELSTPPAADIIRKLIQRIQSLHVFAKRYEIVRGMTVAEWADARQLERVTEKPLDEIIDNLAPFKAEAVKSTCNYPDCNCPLDAPADPNWCARGLPKCT